MAFTADFTQLTSLPANFNATVDDPSRFSAEGYLLKANEVLRVDDGCVTQSIACDVTFVAQKVNEEDGGTPRFILLNGDPSNLWTNLKLTSFPNMTLYAGSGDSEGATSGSIRVNATNWGSHKDPFTLNVKFDGDVWSSKIAGSSTTKTSTLKFSESAYAAPVVNSGNLLIVAPIDLYIKSITAFEFITNIDNANPTEGDRVTLTGSFNATQDPLDKVLLHIDGEVEDITSQVISWNSTNIVLDLNTSIVPYGAGAIEVVENQGNSGKIALTLNPPNNTRTVVVVDPIKNAPGKHSIFDSLSGLTDVLSGDQIQWEHVAGLAVRSNGTFVYSGTDSSFTIRFRIFSKILNTWTTYGDVVVNVNFASLVNLSNLGIDVQPDRFTIEFNTQDQTGTAYIIVSKNPVRPTLEQAKLGKDCYNFDAVASYQITPHISGTTSQLVVGIPNGSYYIFVIQETSSLDVTNTLEGQANILGVPVPPVFTTQPISGTIQESISVSSHDFDIVAAPAKTIQWQIKKSGGEWEDVFGQSSARYNVRGTNYTNAESPIQVRAYVLGEGGADGYSNEVTLTVTEAPYININIPKLPNTARVVLTAESDRSIFHDADESFVNGVAKIYVDHFSNRDYIGHIYYTNPETGLREGTGIDGVTQ